MSKKEKKKAIEADINTMKNISDMIGDLMLELQNIIKGNLKYLAFLREPGKIFTETERFKELANIVHKHKTMRNQKGLVELDDSKLKKYYYDLSVLKNVPIRGIIEALEEEKKKLEIVPSKN